jgi:MoxR-like ATPase
MEYSKVIESMKTIADCGLVSYVEGHAGVGKSSLAKELQKFYENKGEEVHIVTLFGSLLKEGEIGGIPTPYESKDGVMLSKYTIHYKMYDILKDDEEGIRSILFIDELNRCENAVQQELMQIILDRRINDMFLPDSTIIIAAGNPPVDEDNDYQVIEMNDALKDRFFKFTLEPSSTEWLSWALRPENKIHQSIINFIAEYPEYLHSPTSRDEIKPTPRGWEMFSKVYTSVMGTKENVVPNETQVAQILNLANAKLGYTVANAFINFIAEQARPFIKPKDIVDAKMDSEEFNKMLNEFTNDSFLRQFIVIERFVNLLIKNITKLKKNQDILDKFAKFFLSMSEDMQISFFRSIANKNGKLFDIIVDTGKNNGMLDTYFNSMSKVSDVKDS